MKKIKLLLIASIFLLMNSYAGDYGFNKKRDPFSYGGSLSGLKSLGKNDNKIRIGLELRGCYNLDELTTIVGGVAYYTGAKFEGTGIATSFNTTVVPGEISIPTTNRTKRLEIFAEYHRYLVGENEDEFGLYALAGLGYVKYPVSSSLGEFDALIYQTTIVNGAKESLGGIALNLGGGSQFEMDFGYVFGELKMCLPFIQAKSEVLDVKIPSFVSLRAGIRIPLEF